ncbi:LLM class flavin-dependent oxidoreductase [Cohnella yongneupensis]|uniref:LLM class flavin-dependent oxidoreductase n=1 Tax=Cohnella yongneupensis TaxID=425006 RepID=A0ABW0R2F3_9BACL
MSNDKNGEYVGDFEIGLYTFGDLAPDLNKGGAANAHQRVKEIVAAAKLADEAGLDVFGIGEHHRLDMAVSSPPVVLAAIAQATRSIRLISATTVLSTADPVKVFQDFATVDQLSDGRAEIIAGRGAFVESFPLFGYDLDDYEQLFSEKIELLLKLGNNEHISWNGRFRTPLDHAEIAPRPVQQRLPVWIGVGGTPESAARAGRLGTGMSLAILGGDPARFKHLVDIYRQAGTQAGHDLQDLKVAVATHGYIAKTTDQALDEFLPHYMAYFGKLMRERGRAFTMSRDELKRMTGADMALAVGSPEQIIEKLLYQHEVFGHCRYMAQIDIGGQPFAKVAEAIELLAKEVAPVVRREIRRRQAGTRDSKNGV